MSVPGSPTARAKRDTLALYLGLGIPFPLRDLPLDFVADVPHDLATDIRIRGAQGSVVYTLCNEDGIPLQPAITAQLSADQGIESAALGAALLTRGDLQDATGFLSTLTPNATGVAGLLWTRLTPSTQALLAATAGHPTDSTVDTVLQEISAIIRGGSIYEADPFRDVCLSSWTANLLARSNPSATDLARLNRFLLEDAYPLAIWRTLALPTPPISRNPTFTILASRYNSTGVALAETYLAESVSLRAGIASSLAVQFLPNGGQSIVIAYGGGFSVQVDASQEGISYQLLDSTTNAVLSDPVLGIRRAITLLTTVAFNEDDTVKVKAYRTSDPSTFKYLDTQLQVIVMPNPAVGVQVNSAICDYGGQPILALSGYQTTANYTLFQRRIALPEYVSSGTVGALQVTDGAGHVISMLVSDFGDGKAVPPAFATVGPFALAGNTMQITAGPVQEDTFFIAEATKQAHPESLLLSQKIAVLARPSPQPSITVDQASVASGTSGLVIVTGTQRGVQYQLTDDAAGTSIGTPGFHYEDRGIGSFRVGIDFVVEGPIDPRVLLPTGPLTAQSQFKVTAIKTVTTLAAPLLGSATIDVTAPAPAAAVTPPPKPGPPPPPPPPVGGAK